MDGRCWGRGPESNVGFERWGRISRSVGLDKKNWELTLLQHDSHIAYRSSLGAPMLVSREQRTSVIRPRLGVHAFGEDASGGIAYRVIEDVAHVRVGGGETLHKTGRVVWRCLTGRKWRRRQWRLVYSIEQRKEAVYHWEGGFLSAY